MLVCGGCVSIPHLHPDWLATSASNVFDLANHVMNDDKKCSAPNRRCDLFFVGRI